MARPHLVGSKLQTEIIKLAQSKGWHVAHFKAVTTTWGTVTPVSADGKGFPDLILVRDRLIAAEIKGAGESVRTEQKAWQAWLTTAGVSAYVWRPKHWFDGEIDEVLR